MLIQLPTAKTTKSNHDTRVALRTELNEKSQEKSKAKQMTQPDLNLQ